MIRAFHTVFLDPSRCMPILRTHGIIVIKYLSPSISIVANGEKLGASRRVIKKGYS